MTIALGILTFRGVVMAADTLETAHGYWKGEQGKIRWFEHHDTDIEQERRPQTEGACLVSGTGRSGAVDVLSQKLLETFGAHKWVDTPTLKRKFEETLEHYYARDVVPFAAFNDPMDPGLQMIIGCQRGGSSALWTSERTSLEERHAVAIGIGARTATTLIQHIRPFRRLAPHVAAAIAAYIVFEVKEQIDACGRYTDIRIVQDHEVRVVPRSLVEEMEDAFRRYSEEYAPAILQHTFDVSSDVELPTRKLRALRNTITEIVARIPSDSS